MRLAELMLALSIATDLGMGYPLEFALTATMLAVRLGDALRLEERALRETYYLGLLRFIGCNVGTDRMAALLGDEHAARRAFAAVDPGDAGQVLGLVVRFIRQAQHGASPWQVARAVVQGVATARPFMQEQFAGHCEIAQRLAVRLELEPGLVAALGQLYERWDGQGLPRGLKGEAVSVSVRLVSLAQDVMTIQRLHGPDAAVAAVRQRRGGAYDPRAADCLLAHTPMLLAGLDEEPDWVSLLALEPGHHQRLSEQQQVTAFRAMADFADLKSPYTLGHSTAVGELAASAAIRLGLTPTEVTLLRPAGYLHDLGRVGISAAIWGKPGPLSAREWEQVRLHPYYTERILARPAALAQLAELAGQHHERLDGSGYHRRLPAAMQPITARLLAAADVYQALREDRPHRPARSADAAATVLTVEAQAGRLDPEAVSAVLAAAGHQPRSVRASRPANLTEREVTVLRLIARGRTNKEMAHQLSVSAKTIDNHVQHIYEKIAVSTRAGATLFAVEHGLIEPTT